MKKEGGPERKQEGRGGVGRGEASKERMGEGWVGCGALAWLFVDLWFQCS